MTLRPILAFVLAIVLVATGGTAAFSRGKTGVAGQMVICAGGVAVRVPVDADGQPVGPVHFCPDCALSLFDLAPDPASPTQTFAIVATTYLPYAVPACDPQFGVISRARGPPAV